MPTYEYRCAKCGEHLEVYQSFTESPLTKHDSCGGRLSKVLSPAGVILKGKGFYKTDSRDAGKKSAARKESSETKSEKSESTSSSSSSSSSDSSKSGPGDSKAAAKSA